MYTMLAWLISVRFWLQTALLSVSVGTTCTFYQPLIVLEALALTAAIVVALTVYTFNAARKGANFRYGPRSIMSHTCPICLICCMYTHILSILSY